MIKTIVFQPKKDYDTSYLFLTKRLSLSFALLFFLGMALFAVRHYTSSSALWQSELVQLLFYVYASFMLCVFFPLGVSSSLCSLFFLLVRGPRYRAMSHDLLTSPIRFLIWREVVLRSYNNLPD